MSAVIIMRTRDVLAESGAERGCLGWRGDHWDVMTVARKTAKNWVGGQMKRDHWDYFARGGRQTSLGSGMFSPSLGDKE